MCSIKAILLIFLLFFSNMLSAASMQLSDFKIEDYRGEVIYLDFWASWCKPCRASFPWMNEIQRKYAGKLHVFAINVDANRQDAENFLEKYPAIFPIVFDPEGRLGEQFNIQGMPTSILISREGKVVFKQAGFRKQEQEAYEYKIKQQLNI